MEIFRTRAEVRNYLEQVKPEGHSVGFVPTMGALHQGHLSLIEAARNKTDLVVCSIFVNPTQFNDKNDLANYPRPIEDDIHKLREAHCDVLFLPEVGEMYNSADKWNIELENLDNILEGEIRPGHYHGVTQIVKKLFDIISPDYAFFGQKDFQQFVVISFMVKKLGLKVKLIMCPIVREKDGLAMSSRNVYLSQEDRQHALALFKSLSKAKADFDTMSISELNRNAMDYLSNAPGIKTEYFEIYNADTFEPTTSKATEKVIALVAARVGKIRIIDNMILNKN
ncbi:pantoate--beta-alanine ligase [Daejeonella lutea]|uniref:Pantothenate synthetase n=1 Tax=Daejeonella lutea TaxID=572036 RepID=A0A1T5DFK7_9SPHI|nr:pantoate--beta-alanine ligase [Daejeonella lutea]SKB70494.1 pantoate--beta-alanine ligase [Daejeonella lutea]